MPPPSPPTPAAVARAAERSPLRHGPSMSEFADRDELRFREELEPYGDPLSDVVGFIERKELPRKLRYALDRAGLRPQGRVVDLGAGSCWLSATLARESEVERVVAVEFSRRRLEQLAPVAIAYLGAAPEKVERLVADFYNPGLPLGEADLVVMDAAFHHAAEPDRLARVAHGLLRPGGCFFLFREPTLSLLKRTRDHHGADEHGAFEHEYDAREYLRFLREAGFEARKAPASGGFATPRDRALLRPPLSWLRGIAFSEFSYVGRKPL